MRRPDALQLRPALDYGQRTLTPATWLACLLLLGAVATLAGVYFEDDAVPLAIAGACWGGSGLVVHAAAGRLLAVTDARREFTAVVLAAAAARSASLQGLRPVGLRLDPADRGAAVVSAVGPDGEARVVVTDSAPWLRVWATVDGVWEDVTPYAERDAA
jgi:hypothetical protein